MTYLKKPHGFLTSPDSNNPDHFEFRVIVPIDCNYGPAGFPRVIVNPPNGTGIRLIDVILGSPPNPPEPPGQPPVTLFKKDDSFERAPGEIKVQIRVYEIGHGGLMLLGNLTIELEDADNKPISDFVPCCYISNLNWLENTRLSTIMKVANHRIRTVEQEYIEAQDLLELDLGLVNSTPGATHISHILNTDLEEDDRGTIETKVGNDKKGKVTLRKKYADEV